MSKTPVVITIKGERGQLSKEATVEGGVNAVVCALLDEEEKISKKLTAESPRATRKAARKDMANIEEMRRFVQGAGQSLRT